MLEFFIGADNLDGAFVALPDRHSGGPKTITAEVPIWGLLNIFSETTVFKMFWEPVDVFVLIKHQLLLAFNIKEPAWKSAVHNALFGTRVKRIVVLDILDFIDNFLFF